MHFLDSTESKLKFNAQIILDITVEQLGKFKINLVVPFFENLLDTVFLKEG